jgi:integrase/recombinase XerD
MAGKKRRQMTHNTKSVPYSKLLDNFLRDCKIKGLADRTLFSYETGLRKLEDFLDENNIKDMRTINKDDIKDFTLWLMNKLENKTSINTYIRTARVFLYYAMSEDIIDDFKINLIKDDEIKAKKTYTDEEIEKLIKPPNLKECSFAEYRNWVLVQYLLETGNRLNTVRHIKVKDLDLDAAMMTLKTTKNRRQQFSPLSQTMIEILNNYITTWDFDDDEYLFPTEDGLQMTSSGMRTSIIRYNERRGVANTSIHNMRHTFARNYLLTEGNAFKLQRLLGHSTLDTTNLYINLYGHDLAQDFEKHSIIERHNKKKNKKKRRGK